jgi:hypothetical protein
LVFFCHVSSPFDSCKVNYNISIISYVVFYEIRKKSYYWNALGEFWITSYNASAVENYSDTSSLGRFEKYFCSAF